MLIKKNYLIYRTTRKEIKYRFFRLDNGRKKDRKPVALYVK